MYSETQLSVRARRSSPARVFPLLRAATRLWLKAVSPEGQVGNQLLAVLPALGVEWLRRRTGALLLTDFQLAEKMNIS